MNKPTIEEQEQLVARWERLSSAVENGFYESHNEIRKVYREMDQIEKQLQSVLF